MFIILNDDTFSPLILFIKGKEIRINKAPKMRIHSMENVSVCLDFLKSEGIKCTSIGADNIVDGDKKLTFGITFYLSYCLLLFPLILLLFTIIIPSHSLIVYYYSLSFSCCLLLFPLILFLFTITIPLILLLFTIISSHSLVAHYHSDVYYYSLSCFCSLLLFPLILLLFTIIIHSHSLAL
jgi:hypothetical protein